MAEKELQMEAVFHGDLQGIGFRYTVEILANSLFLRGYVKNLDNGDVQVLAIGEKKQLDLLLDQIRDRFEIQDQTVSFSKDITYHKKHFIVSF